ncbi:hypothetical protein H8356DRAFT_940515 [Neocallimastix lanati (nom. inval.)]|uniref:Uncharacterized protein n=1 Tax=Neocallimastix californiae TaxID=1754190 RepID=A0A1Y2BI34_9FUNG|nr:hypothetical protein H8356DRAFT_940515 [Neocallimastix sp. JGI-2020a]ORY34449.1 hypothetical protein LY90DRAFT_511846 [Neocallimastix californiae]|eukprot:ORY34449.1 hypothetical protein LY90DRAFT_511846 [Neocallimastix californiae]
MEDVVMTDAYPVEYERDIPMFNGETGDVESFIDRLKRYFGRHQKYYQSEPTAMLYFIEDHLQGTAKKWYQMDEVFKQRDDPQPQRLMDRLLKEFKSERTLEERYEYDRERKIAIMALLGMMDPRRPSKDIETKRRRNSDNRLGDKRDYSRKEPTKQNNYDKKKDNHNHNSGKDFSTRPSEKQNYFKDSRTSSNNPIPKTALLMQDWSEYEEFVPEAKISNLRTKEGLQDLNMLYDTGSQITMIHPQLAKEMGLKIEDRPLTFTTAAGSRFMNRHLIYRKVDVHDKQPKVYKIDGERPGLPDVDSPGECEGESIYMVQEIEDKEPAVQREIQLTTRITKIIQQVIDNQKLKDTVYDLTRQFYRERGIEYAIDYYDYLIDYDKWADWFKAQKSKNLKENKINKNPTENVATKDSQEKDNITMITQEDSVAETIKKVGLEKLLSIGEIIGKYYGDLTEAFNECY